MKRCDGCNKLGLELKQYASAKFCLHCWWSRVPEMPGPNPDARVAELEAGLREVFSAVESLAFSAPENSHIHMNRIAVIKKVLKVGK